MGRALVAVSLALALCFGVLAGLVLLTADEDTVAVDPLLAERLGRAVVEAGQTGEPVDLARLAPFPWDRVVVFKPRTAGATVDRALGFEFRGDLPYDAESSEVFVFVDGRSMARFADYRGRASFAGLERPVASIPRERAVFDVRDGVARLRR